MTTPVPPTPPASLPSLPGLIFPVTRANTGFNVAKQEPISGARRTRFPFRNTPVRSWEIGFDILRSKAFGQSAFSELQTLEGFYNSVYGTSYAFSYTDDTYNSVSGAPFGVGDGTSTAFQLVAQIGGFTESVYLPTGTPEIFINSSLQTSGYLFNSVGVITFDTAPASGTFLSWTGTYDWLCRFDSETVNFKEIMSGIWQLDKLTFSNELLG